MVQGMNLRIAKSITAKDRAFKRSPFSLRFIKRHLIALRGQEENCTKVDGIDWIDYSC